MVRSLASLTILGLILAGCPTRIDRVPPDRDDDDAADDDTWGDDDVADDDDVVDDDVADDDDDDVTGDVEPPLYGASGGSGGSTCPNGCTESADGINYNIIVPNSYNASSPNELLIVYSGTEGGSMMTQNMLSLAAYSGIGDAIIAVLDGYVYYGDGQAGAAVLDDVRARYNVDNDRTWLLSESAGTSAGLQLGFHLRQSYFAAFWANDVNAADTPGQTAAQLGFEPWGNSGPGGDYADANTIVAGMDAAGYRLPNDAPYSGPGAGQHGSTEQFMEAVGFFAGKSRL